MNLGKDIYNLLKRQTEVYVRGVGTFKKNHTPAVYDEKKQVYLPPINYVVFDKINENGYDFIQYVQTLYAIDRSEAEERVAVAVAGLLHLIREEGQAKLDDLGYLVSYGDGYVFKALDLSGFNYQPVEASASETEAKQEPTPTDVPLEQVEEKVVDHPAPTENIEEQSVKTEVEEEVVLEEERRSNNMIWYVILAIVALGALITLYVLNQNKETVPSAEKKPQTQNPLASDTLDKVVSLGDSTLIADTSQVVGTDSAQVVAQKQPLIPEHHTWQIVIGSHLTLAQAYEQAESYNKAGYSSVRVIPSNLAKNRKKVIWDSYATKAEVDSALRYVQKHIIKDAWPDKIK